MVAGLPRRVCLVLSASLGLLLSCEAMRKRSYAMV